MRFNKIGLVVGMAFFISMSVCAQTNEGNSVMRGNKGNPSDQRKGIKMEQFLDGRLPIGFYFQTYGWKQQSDPSEHDMDDAITEIARLGFNYLYVRGAGDGSGNMWPRLLELCGKYHVAVIPQLDFAYLGDPKANVDTLVERAVPFIKKYKDHPALMAFSVCEEPSSSHMSPLKRYYEGILRKVPDAPLHLLMDTLPHFVTMEPPYPEVLGTDRYAFWWEFGDGGGRAAPSYALSWYQSQLCAYSQLTAAYGSEFQAVFTANTLEFFISPENARLAFYPASIPEKQRDQYFQTLQANVKNKNLGWDQSHDGLYRYWKYYRPPANCMRAMSWLAIMEGARSVAVWHWGPFWYQLKDFRNNGKPGVEYISSITGWDGKGTPQLDEFAEASREIQRYSKLIRVMSKEYKPLEKILLPAGQKPAANKHEDSVTDDFGDPVPVFEIMNGNAGGGLPFWRSFKVPSYLGKVVLIVNAGVGSWCEGRSPSYPQGDTVYRIDDFGNAVDYTPFKEARDMTCRVPLKNMDCFDLETGKSVPMKDDRTLSVSIVPGGGKFLFLAPRGSDEWTRLKKQFGF